MNSVNKSVYFHIPFCNQICHYCDFNKFLLEYQPIDEYLQSLALEVEMSGVTSAKTIFLGGGTPTALEMRQLDHLLKMIHERIQVTDEIEFTIEANPCDLTEEKLQLLRDYGVNRLSIGVQTFHDDLLNLIGRNHREADIYHAVWQARQVGFKNISLDLIFALPHQTLSMVEHDLQKAIDLSVEHVSVYSLIIEPKTVFYQQASRNQLAQPGEVIEAEMYQLVMQRLAEAGFIQYEISNYGKEGFFSQHNLTYWNNEEYYGFGTGAHGYLSGIRYENYKVIKKYIQAIQAGKKPILNEHFVSEREQMEEEMILGLRKTAGISQTRFFEKFGLPLMKAFPNVVEKLMNMQLLGEEGDYIHLTQKGKLVGNEVFERFLG